MGCQQSKVQFPKKINNKKMQLVIISQEGSSVVQQDDHQFRNNKIIAPLNPYEKLDPPTQDLKIHSRDTSRKTTINPFQYQDIEIQLINTNNKNKNNPEQQHNYNDKIDYVRAKKFKVSSAMK